MPDIFDEIAPTTAPSKKSPKGSASVVPSSESDIFDTAAQDPAYLAAQDRAARAGMAAGRLASVGRGVRSITPNVTLADRVWSDMHRTIARQNARSDQYAREHPLAHGFAVPLSWLKNVIPGVAAAIADPNNVEQADVRQLVTGPLHILAGVQPNTYDVEWRRQLAKLPLDQAMAVMAEKGVKAGLGPEQQASRAEIMARNPVTQALEGLSDLGVDIPTNVATYAMPLAGAGGAAAREAGATGVANAAHAIDRLASLGFSGSAAKGAYDAATDPDLPAGNKTTQVILNALFAAGGVHGAARDVARVHRDIAAEQSLPQVHAEARLSTPETDASSGRLLDTFTAPDGRQVITGEIARRISDPAFTGTGPAALAVEPAIGQAPRVLPASDFSALQDALSMRGTSPTSLKAQRRTDRIARMGESQRTYTQPAPTLPDANPSSNGEPPFGYVTTGLAPDGSLLISPPPESRTALVRDAQGRVARVVPGAKPTLSTFGEPDVVDQPTEIGRTLPNANWSAEQLARDAANAQAAQQRAMDRAQLEADIAAGRGVRPDVADIEPTVSDLRSGPSALDTPMDVITGRDRRASRQPTAPVERRANGPAVDLNPRSEDVSIFGPPENSAQASTSESPVILGPDGQAVDVSRLSKKARNRIIRQQSLGGQRNVRETVQVGSEPPQEPRPPAASSESSASRPAAPDMTDTSDKTAGHVAGAQDVAYTPGGQPVGVHYALVPMDDLIPSHTDNLSENPRYDQSLQPRDRSRAASGEQVARLAAGLNPKLLDRAPTTADGAPVIGRDNMVESGNGRLLALRRARAAHPDRYASYVAHLEEVAPSMGLDPADVTRMAQEGRSPVLVRVRDSYAGNSTLTPQERAQFAQEAGAPTVASMSESETARSDAGRIASRGLLRPDANGVYPSPGSATFRQRFLDTVPANERPGMIQPDGELSNEGRRRIQNAVLAAAFDDPTAISRALEDPNDATKNVARAVLQVAPKLAAIRDLAARGELYDLDLNRELSQAVNTVAQLRERGVNVAEWLATDDMFGERPAMVDALMRTMEDYKRSPKALASVLDRYTGGVFALGNPADGNLFGDMTPPSKMEVFAAAREVADPNATLQLGIESQINDTPVVGTPGQAEGGPQAGEPDSQIGRATGGPDVSGRAAGRAGAGPGADGADAGDQRQGAAAGSPEAETGRGELTPRDRRDRAAQYVAERMERAEAAKSDAERAEAMQGTSPKSLSREFGISNAEAREVINEVGGIREELRNLEARSKRGGLTADEQAALDAAKQRIAARFRRILRGMNEAGSLFPKGRKLDPPVEGSLVDDLVTVIRGEAKRLRISVQEAAENVADRYPRTAGNREAVEEALARLSGRGGDNSRVGAANRQGEAAGGQQQPPSSSLSPGQPGGNRGNPGSRPRLRVSLGMGEQIATLGKLATGKPLGPQQGIKLPSTKLGRSILNKVTQGGRLTEYLVPEAAGALPAIENARRGVFGDWFERHYLRGAFDGMSDVDRQKFVLYGLLDRLYAKQRQGGKGVRAVEANIAALSDTVAKQLGREGKPIQPGEVAAFMRDHADAIAKYKRAQAVSDQLRGEAGKDDLQEGLFGKYYVPAIPEDAGGSGVSGGGGLTKPVFRMPRLAGQQGFTGTSEAYSTDPIEAMRAKFSNNAVVAHAARFWKAAIIRGAAIPEVERGELPAGITRATEQAPNGGTRDVLKMTVRTRDGAVHTLTAQRFDLASMGYSPEHLQALGLPQYVYAPGPMLKEVASVFGPNFAGDAQGPVAKLTDVFLSGPTEALAHGRTLGSAVASTVPGTTGIPIVDAATYALRGTGLKTVVHTVKLFGKRGSRAYPDAVYRESQRLANEYGVARPEVTTNGIRKIGGRLIYGEGGLHDNALAAIYQFGKENGWPRHEIGLQLRNLATQSEFLKSDLQKFMQGTVGGGSFYSTNSASIARGLKYGTPTLAATLIYQSLLAKQADKRLHGGAGRWWWQIPGRKPWEVPVAKQGDGKDIVMSFKLDRDAATAERWFGNAVSAYATDAGPEEIGWGMAADAGNYLLGPAETGPQMSIAAAALGRSPFLVPSRDYYGVEPLPTASAKFPALSKERAMEVAGNVLPLNSILGEAAGSLFPVGSAAELRGSSPQSRSLRIGNELAKLVGVSVKTEDPDAIHAQSIKSRKRRERIAERLGFDGAGRR